MSRHTTHLILTFLFLSLVFISGCNERYGMALICLILAIYFLAQLSSFVADRKPSKSFIKSMSEELDAFEEMVGNACVRIETNLIDAWQFVRQLFKRFSLK